MRLIGSHFVIGQTIDEALSRARGHAEFRYSFDMLGEGARTAAGAENYSPKYASITFGSWRTASGEPSAIFTP